MDWKNVNLNDRYEREQNIIDPLNFDILLLEITCNIKDSEINIDTITKQFETDLRERINSAREVFKNNKENILKNALEYSQL